MKSTLLIKVCLLGFSLSVTGSLLDFDKLIYNKSDLALAENELVVFSDRSTMAGVNLTSSQWGGVWADYDNDGDQDLYAGNHFDTPNLYRNNGDGTFTDVRTLTGINAGPSDWHGAAWGDYNNDGRPDLYVAVGNAVVGGSDFYINNSGVFTEGAAGAGITNENGRGRVPRWADYDQDGDLDLFVTNDEKITAPSVLYKNNNNGTFTDVSVQASVAITSGTKGSAWADYDRDGDTDFLVIEDGSGGSGYGFSLYQNQGDGTFVNVVKNVGFSKQFSETGAWGDYDNDGDLDLYFSRGYEGLEDKLIWDTKAITAILSLSSGSEEGLVFTSTTGTVNFDLWQADRQEYPKDITFGSTNQHPVAMPFTLDDTTNHVGQPSYTPGVTTGAFIWRNSLVDPWDIRWSRGNINYQVVGVITTPGEFTEVTSVGLDPPSTFSGGNALYRNKGNGTFEQVPNAAGMQNTSFNSKDAHWIDVDNDADLDLYVTNMGNTYKGDEPNRLFRNNGDGTFTDIAAAAGLLGLINGNDTCSAWADFNNDGFLDVYLANNPWRGYLSGPQKLLVNGGNDNNWLKITLTGTNSNRLGIGAKIQVTTGNLTQFREMAVATTGACHDSLVAHFGLNDYTQANVITVTWPSGYVQVLNNVSADQMLNIVEGTQPLDPNAIYLPIVIDASVP